MTYKSKGLAEKLKERIIDIVVLWGEGKQGDRLLHKKYTTFGYNVAPDGTRTG